MLLPLIALVVWFTYVEVEHPNRVNECPYVEELCEQEENNG
jgi:hypothetical protein